MKIKLTVFATIALASSASATIALNTFFGVATDSSSVAVPDGTLWALVVDNGDNTFAGGLGLNASVTTLGANTDFVSGQSLSLGGLIGSDTIFAIGGFNGNVNFASPGFSAEALNLTLGVNGLAAGRNTAFYFFPGATYTGGASETIGSQVGGFNAGEDSANGLSMVIPADGSTVGFGALDTINGGIVSPANMQAVNLTAIPEPSAALLGALGALGLLRRRRA